MEVVVIGHLGEVGLDRLEVLEVRAHGEEEAEALEVAVVLEVVEVLAAEDQVGPGKKYHK